MAMNIRSINKVYVHAGEFNTDDVISAAIIRIVNPKIEIIRTNEKNNLESGSISLGGKGKYNYMNNPYIKDDHKNPYSLTTYVYEGCADLLLQLSGINNVEKAKELFYSKYVAKIAVGTRRGFQKVGFFGENNVLLAMNSYWYEPMNGHTNSDIQFFLAVDMAEIIIDNWLKEIKEEVDFREIEDEIWDRAEANSEDGIYILERHIPWQYQVKKNPNTTAKIIIFKSNRGEGKYNIVSKSTDEIKIQDSEYLTFVHPSRFMGVADSLDSAIFAARQTIGAVQMAY